MEYVFSLGSLGKQRTLDRLGLFQLCSEQPEVLESPRTARNAPRNAPRKAP